jgi:hypothetical protein
VASDGGPEIVLMWIFPRVVQIVTRTVRQFVLAYRRKIRHARDQLDHKLKSTLAELVSQALALVR